MGKKDRKAVVAEEERLEVRVDRAAGVIEGLFRCVYEHAGITGKATDNYRNSAQYAQAVLVEVKEALESLESEVETLKEKLAEIESTKEQTNGSTENACENVTEFPGGGVPVPVRLPQPGPGDELGPDSGAAGPL